MGRDSRDADGSYELPADHLSDDPPVVRPDAHLGAKRRAARLDEHHAFNGRAAGAFHRRSRCKHRPAGTSDAVARDALQGPLDSHGFHFGECALSLPSVAVSELPGQKGSLVELGVAVVRGMDIAESCLDVRHLREPGQPLFAESPGHIVRDLVGVAAVGLDPEDVPTATLGRVSQAPEPGSWFRRQSMCERMWPRCSVGTSRPSSSWAIGCSAVTSRVAAKLRENLFDTRNTVQREGTGCDVELGNWWAMEMTGSWATGGQWNWVHESGRGRQSRPTHSLGRGPIAVLGALE
jgi:hypothetical protein